MIAPRPPQNDDEPIEAQLAPPPKRKWHQFTLGKLMTIMVLSSLTFALVSGAFRAEGAKLFPVFVMLAALAPLAILMIFGVARIVFNRPRGPRRRW